MIFNPIAAGEAGTELVTLDLTNNNGAEIYGWTGSGESFFVETGSLEDVSSISVPKNSLVFIYSKLFYVYPMIDGNYFKIASNATAIGTPDSVTLYNWTLFRITGDASLSVYVS